MTNDELHELHSMYLERRHLSTIEHTEHFAVEAWPGYEDFTAEFVVYPWWGPEGGYQRKNSPSSPDVVQSIDDAEWFCLGSVRRDGCVNFKYNNRHGFIHDCSNPSDSHAEMWDTIWGMAIALMPRLEDISR